MLVPCGQNNGFKLRAEDLEAAITPKTRWFMLNNPCNPTGAAYSAEELKPICEVLMRHPQVWVLTDDIYDKLVYDGFKPGTIVAVEPRLRDRTLTVHGVSKSYAMTGWRIGFAGGPVALIKAMDKLQSQSTSNPNSIAQAAAVEALLGQQETVEEMRKVFEQRRDLVVEMLNQAPGINCSKPEGAFYVYPSIHGCIGKTSKGGVLIKDDEAFALTLAGRGRRRHRARRGVLLSRLHPHQLRQRDRRTARSLHPHPTLLPGPALKHARRPICRRQRPVSSQRIGRVQLAASVQMTIKARELKAAGKPVITLTTGEPNFDSPPHAIEAAHQAALKGDTKYPPQDGTRVLKEAIQRKFKRDSGLDYALDEITVSNGGKQSLFNAIMATVDPGDEVIIPVPSWIAYTQMTELCEGVPVLVNCPQNNGFKPRAEDIDAAITPRTRWLILNNPNNPTGACCSAAEIAEIAAVMRKHPHVWVLSDDMYEHLVFDGFQHATFAQVAPDLKDRTLTVSGVSKTYAMTGWRVGFAGGPKRADQGDDRDAGARDRRDFDGRAGSRGGGAGRTAGWRRRADRGLQAAARPRG